MNGGKLIRIGVFLYGISFLTAGAMILFISQNPIFALAGMTAGVIMTVIAYLKAEFQTKS
jgi:hypothetical protein